MDYLIIAILIAALGVSTFKLLGKKSSKKPVLDIELVPFSMHGCNVRSRISSEQWKKVCTVTHQRAKNGHRCQICNQSGKSQGFPHPVECHEIWSFDEVSHTQRLEGLISLCPLCHKVKHLGLADMQGYGAIARQHMRRVNRMSIDQVDQHIQEATVVVKERSQVNWKLDLTYLNNPEFNFLLTEFTDYENSNCQKLVF